MSKLRRQFGRLVATGASKSAWWRYGIGVALALIALVISNRIFSLQRAPFFPLFSLAVVVAAVLGGRASGLVATATSVLLNFLALPPRWSLRVSDTESLVRVMVFLIAGTALSILIGLVGDFQHTLDIERERLFTTLASIGDCVVTTDPSGHVMFMNAVAETATGWASAEAAGRPLEDIFRIVNEKTRQPAPDPVHKVIESGRIVGLANHTILVRRDGTEIPIDDSAAPIRDLQGRIAGVVLVFRDVTQERQSQAALIRSEKLASVGRIAASIAHEINNPLAAISNLLYLIENATDRTTVHMHAQAAQRELNRVSHVTKHTLSFARRSHTQEEVELSSLVDEVLGLYSNKLDGRTIQVVKRYKGHTVAKSSTSEAMQVIANVIANALDASSKGGKLHLRIATSTWDSRPRVRLTVADTGSGIQKEHLSKIFEPFFSTKDKTGTGLGLWVTQEIMNRHDGCVHVRSRIGSGTVVIVCWPAASTLAENRAAGSPDC